VGDEQLVSIIEIVSRGNKDSRMRFEQFLTKVATALNEGIHVMVVDLHPPTKYDADGIHAAIWDYLYGETDQRNDKSAKLTVVSYCADAPVTAYHEPIDVGHVLPDMPLFLESDNYILLPLESTYEENWNDYPRQWRERLTSVQESEEPK